MEQVARVVLALEAAEVAEEVMHFLDRSGRARVVGTAADRRQLAEAVRQLEPDAIVAEPALAFGAVDHGTLLALATRESVASLRAAVRAGARGFYVWPGEREGLLDGVAATLDVRPRTERSAVVVAVHGARGGVGTTFVASHLAAALARRDLAGVLVDGDPAYGDLSASPRCTRRRPHDRRARTGRRRDDMGPRRGGGLAARGRLLDRARTTRRRRRGGACRSRAAGRGGRRDADATSSSCIFLGRSTRRRALSGGGRPRARSALARRVVVPRGDPRP